MYVTKTVAQVTGLVELNLCKSVEDITNSNINEMNLRMDSEGNESRAD